MQRWQVEDSTLARDMRRTSDVSRWRLDSVKAWLRKHGVSSKRAASQGKAGMVALAFQKCPAPEPIADVPIDSAIVKLNKLTSSGRSSLFVDLPSGVQSQIMSLDFDSWEDVKETLACSDGTIAALQEIVQEADDEAPKESRPKRPLPAANHSDADCSHSTPATFEFDDFEQPTILERRTRYRPHE